MRHATSNNDNDNYDDGNDNESEHYERQESSAGY